MGLLTSLKTTRAFTGHEHIAEFPGLVHMNARVYDSDLGRFLSADTMIPSPYHSQSYNRYSYLNNNPLGDTDSTGYSADGSSDDFDGWTEEDAAEASVQNEEIDLGEIVVVADKKDTNKADYNDDAPSDKQYISLDGSKPVQAPTVLADTMLRAKTLGSGVYPLLSSFVS